MIMFCGTPALLEDTRRGLFGYEALRSRLCDSRFATAEVGSVSGPVIRLRRLSDDEMFALLMRVGGLYAQLHPDAPRLSGELLEAFYLICNKRAGAEEMMTPREMIRDYLFLLDAMRENPALDPMSLMSGGGDTSTVQSTEGEMAEEDVLPAPRVRGELPDPEEIEI